MYYVWKIKTKMCLTAVAVFLSLTFAHSRGSSVDLLNQATFTSSIIKIPHFVLFYAPWCGHCKRLLASWNELADKTPTHDRNVKIAKVNCMEDTALCSELNILAYPTMKLFHKGGMRRFDGRRNVNELEIFIDKVLRQVDVEENEGLVTLTAENFDGHIRTGLHFVEFFAPWCVHCIHFEPTWKVIAKHFEKNPDITICKVDCTAEGSKCQELKIPGFPTLKLYKDGMEVDQYNLERTMAALLTYVSNNLNHYGLANLDSDDQHYPEQTRLDEVQHNLKDKVAEQNEENIADTADMHPVIELLEQTFESVLEETTFVLFYVPWCTFCQQLKPTWETLGKHCQEDGGPIIARIDCSKFLLTCEKYQVTLYPTLTLFKQGQRYNYDKERDIESLYKFARKCYHDEL